MLERRRRVLVDHRLVAEREVGPEAALEGFQETLKLCATDRQRADCHAQLERVCKKLGDAEGQEASRVAGTDLREAIAAAEAAAEKKKAETSTEAPADDATPAADEDQAPPAEGLALDKDSPFVPI